VIICYYILKAFSAINLNNMADDGLMEYMGDNKSKLMIGFYQLWKPEHLYKGTMFDIKQKIENGEIIMTKTSIGTCYHYGIAVRNNLELSVYHFCKKDNEIKLNKTTLEEFIRNNARIGICKKMHDKNNTATNMLKLFSDYLSGKTELIYNLITENCESLVEYCVDGKFTSKQSINLIIPTITAIIAGFLTKDWFKTALITFGVSACLLYFESFDDIIICE
jgi:hypothetical protein